MPIRKFLAGYSFDQEAIEAMSRAIVAACDAAGSKVGDDEATRRVAERVIDAAGDGERDPEKLKTAALRKLRQ